MRRALWAQPPSSPPRPGLRHGDDRIWSDTCPVRYREQEESRAAQRARSERIELELELRSRSEKAEAGEPQLAPSQSEEARKRGPNATGNATCPAPTVSRTGTDAQSMAIPRAVLSPTLRSGLEVLHEVWKHCRALRLSPAAASPSTAPI